jgi:hypothetical protein
MQIAHEFIPTNCVTIRPNDKIWMTFEIRKEIRIRDRLRKKYISEDGTSPLMSIFIVFQYCLQFVFFNSDKDSGPDRFSNKMLREVKYEIAGPLCLLFSGLETCPYYPDIQI